MKYPPLYYESFVTILPREKTSSTSNIFPTHNELSYRITVLPHLDQQKCVGGSRGLPDLYGAIIARGCYTGAIVQPGYALHLVGMATIRLKCVAVGSPPHLYGRVHSS